MATSIKTMGSRLEEVVTTDTLFQFIDDSDVEIPPVSDVQVTNGLVLDLYHFMNGHQQCTFYTLRLWLRWLLQEKWPTGNAPAVNSIRQSVLRLSARLSKLKKECNSDRKEVSISSFLDEPYSLPRVLVPNVKCHSPSSCSSCSENESLKFKLSKLELNNQAVEDKLTTSRKKMYSLHRNTAKRLKRRDDTIVAQSKLITEKDCLLSNWEKRLNNFDERIGKLKHDKDCLRHKLSYWKKQFDQMKLSSDEKTDDLVMEYEKNEKELTEKMYQIEEENSELRELVDDLMISTTDITTFAQGKYTDDIRLCCYELLSLNVGVRNIKPVITSVLRNIAKKNVSRLPSKALLCNMMLESLTLAQAQLGEELSSEEKDYFTIQTDGTTKYGQHFDTYDVSTNDHAYTLGLRHIFSGSSQTTLDTLKEILDDLDTVHIELGRTEISSKILARLKNTMSDRHSAEKLFNDILADYRAEVLPEVINGWSGLEQSERDQITRMNNFFCGLHYLVGLANAAEATLQTWEATINEENIQTQSSGTQRLIRTACKAFHHRGSEQAGCSTKFRSFLRQQRIYEIPLAAFQGNRFNILFYDAAGVYFLHEYMLQYLFEIHGTLNRLLQAVLSDLKVPSYIAACKALGVIDKIVTGPFWRLLQTSTVSILEMGNVYTKMVNQFEKWADDAQLIMEGKEVLFEEDRFEFDTVAKKIFSSTLNDSLVQEILQLLFKAFAVTTRRLVIDHLPDGIFHSITDDRMIAETNSVPKTNVSPERDFAILDRLMSEKPNATYIALEAVILYSHNKTSEWLDAKTTEEKERLLQAARTLTSVHRLNFRKRRDEIIAKRLVAIEEKQEEMRKKKEKELREKEKLTKEVQKVSLWTTCEEVARGLESLPSKTKKIAALKLQMNFRKKVLCQTHTDKFIFAFSNNGRAYAVSELTNNLLKLLSVVKQPLTPEDISGDPYCLVYRRIEHLFMCDNGLNWFKGTVVGYNSETSEFRVAYDGEEDEYNYPLLEDLLNGELIID